MDGQEYNRSWEGDCLRPVIVHEFLRRGFISVTGLIYSKKKTFGLQKMDSGLRLMLIRKKICITSNL